MSHRKRIVREFFRRSVFERDGHKCRKCGATGDLDAHHITDRSEMPNGGYVSENGIALCPLCHMKAEEYHRSDGFRCDKGWRPKDLYSLINSDYETAYCRSKRLDW